MGNLGSARFWRADQDVRRSAEKVSGFEEYGRLLPNRIWEGRRGGKDQGSVELREGIERGNRLEGSSRSI